MCACVLCVIYAHIRRAVCVSIQEDEGNMFFKVTELVGFIWCFRFTSSFEITMMSLSKPRKNLSTEKTSRFRFSLKLYIRGTHCALFRYTAGRSFNRFDEERWSTTTERPAKRSIKKINFKGNAFLRSASRVRSFLLSLFASFFFFFFFFFVLPFLKKERKLSIHGGVRLYMYTCAYRNN